MLNPPADQVLEQLDNEALSPELQSIQQRLARNPRDTEAAALLIRHHLDRARQSSDPRYLGYAQAILERWPTDELPTALRLLRASVHQSLHRFEPALDDLRQVLDEWPGHPQALLTAAVIQLVQGNYEGARRTCRALNGRVSPLLAQSCTSQWLARTGAADDGFRQLLQSYEAQPDAGAADRQWTLVTLAELAEQRADPRAAEFWQKALALSPDDLYTRLGAANEALARGQFGQVLALTQGYEFADTLLLTRALTFRALQQTDELQPLLEQLEQRFAEARWRQEMLHGREYALYLLELRQDPNAALQMARDNWQVQREPADTQILLQAARAANRVDVVQEVQAWLRAQGQEDMRYPLTAGLSAEREVKL